jgi:protein-S-isoprenylcysteine O-methyltransferase Ste14
MRKILIPPVIAAICLVMIVIFYYKFSKFNFIPFPYNLIGLNLTLVGFSIMGKANRLYSKYKTTITFNKSSHLITDGIYKKSRNPLYFGMFLFLLGISVCFRNIFSLLVPFLFILIIKIIYIPIEEMMLVDLFGQQYKDYKKSTRKFI